MADYVKFIKGSSKAFEQLSNKDDSTLYFITDSESGDLSLYLGNTLISSGIVEPEQLNLKDLLDVTLSDSVLESSILTFNGTEWINTSLEIFKSWLDIPTMPEVMKGASETEDGLSGLVPVPTIDVRNNFLRGDGTWTDITPIISDVVATVVDGAPEAFDTLKEVSDWILNDETGAAALATKVGNLETLTQTHNTEITNLQSTVGTLQTDVKELQDTVNDLVTGGDVDLTGYITRTEFTTVVGNLSDLNNYNEEITTNLVNEINQINERLMWQTLTEN